MGTLSNKVCIVTGGNTGIGKETARGLAREGATVVIACRDVTKAEAARADIVASTGNSAVEVMPLDLASKSSIRAFATAFRSKHRALHVLVNNAGLWTRTQSKTPEGFESTFGVNHLGPFLLTHELIDLLRASAPARIVNVSSGLHYRGVIDWDDLMCERKSFSGSQAYQNSKLANVLFTNKLARILAGSGVTANSLHPGVVSTELTRELPRIAQWIWRMVTVTPEKGARTSIYLATSPEVEGATGKYYDDRKEKAPKPIALDTAAQDRLWGVSEKLVGIEWGRRDAGAVTEARAVN